jgi:SPP1 gp7 family putative phage head morphogenesis protein
MSNYWQKRFQAVEEMNNKRAKEVVQSITPAFDQAQAQIEKEINAWYARFAKNNQISLQEAKKLLNTKELKEFHWDVEEYIKYGRQNAIDQQWMKQLENASARFHVSRLEALKIRTQNAAERAFGNELDQLDSMAARLYMDDYYHTAYEIQRGLGIGFDVAQIDQRKLDNLLSKPWTADNKTFKDRIWTSKTSMISELHNQMTRMCILGKSPDEAIREMEKFVDKKFDNARMAAGRLVMTESAYFASAAQKDCFNDLDVEKFEIVATLDSHTSEICQQMDGQVFDMKDFKAGVTAPPFHVWCRSCTCPWFEDNNDGKRAARGADGKTYYVPADMKYGDWKQTFVDKTKDPSKYLEPASVEDVKKAKLTIEELNASGSKMLGEVYEHHRIKDGLKSTPYADMVGSTMNPVYADYGKLSVESATVFNDTVAELVSQYDTPLSTIRTMTADERVMHGGALAFVRHNYTVDSAELVIDAAKCKDLDKLRERLMKSCKKGFNVKVPDDLLEKYVPTHEFAHTLINLEQPLSNKTNWLGADYNKIKKARKEIKSVHEEYMSEVAKLTKKYKDAELAAITVFSEESWKMASDAKEALNAVKFSEYSLYNADEFMAEAFANEKLGVSSNPYAQKVVSILDKYFKR